MQRPPPQRHSPAVALVDVGLPKPRTTRRVAVGAVRDDLRRRRRHGRLGVCTAGKRRVGTPPGGPRAQQACTVASAGLGWRVSAAGERTCAGLAHATHAGTWLEISRAASLHRRRMQRTPAPGCRVTELPPLPHRSSAGPLLTHLRWRLQPPPAVLASVHPGADPEGRQESKVLLRKALGRGPGLADFVQRSSGGGVADELQKGREGGEGGRRHFVEGCHVRLGRRETHTQRLGVRRHPGRRGR